jgi:septal ring factor EnvC (AmiA/AmiB activator)
MTTFMDRSEGILFFLGSLALAVGGVMLTHWEPGSDTHDLGKIILAVALAFVAFLFAFACVRFFLRWILAKATNWQDRPVLQTNVRRLKKERDQATERAQALHEKMTRYRHRSETLSDQFDEEKSRRERFERWWHEETSKTKKLKKELTETRDALQREVRRSSAQLEAIAPEPPGSTLDRAFPERFTAEDAGDTDKAIAFLTELNEE